MPTNPLRAIAGLLAVVGLVSPAAAQPWESTPTIGLRPLTTPSQPSPSPTAPAKPDAKTKPAAPIAAAKPEAKPAIKPAPTLVGATRPAVAHPTPAPISAPKPAASINMPYPRVVTPTTAPPSAPAARNAVMIIDAARMADPKTGVRQLARAFDQLRGEFADRSRTLQTLKTQADSAALTLNGTTPPSTVVASQSRAQINQYQTEGAAYQAAFNARLSVLVSPVETQVHNALTAFAAAHGAAVVIDRSRFKDSVLMLQPGLDPNTLDMTQAFIDGYNAAHP